MSKKNILEKTIEENKIVIITIPNCSYCVKAKKYLESKKKKYKEILYNSELDEEFWKRYKKKYPFVPRIIIDKEFIGGFTELKEYKKDTPKKEEPKKKETPKKELKS